MSLASRVSAVLLRSGPAVTRELDVRRNLTVRAPDGAGLLTDVYLAAHGGPLPVILMRSPYGRGALGTAARLFAERGYHAVVQSTRGTSGSDGSIDFDAEAGDGRATADWIVDQSWSDGTIGTYGASYLSFTQLALASTRPPQLKAMAIAVWGADRRAYYQGGAFALERALGWTYTMANLERPLGILRALVRERRELRPALGRLPLLEADTAAVGHPVAFYRDWITHEAPGDPYWSPTDFRPLLASLDVPVTMTAGWYDMFLPQMLDDYQALAGGGQDVRLRVGAWHHRSQGLARQSLADALDWFGTHLLGRRRTAARPAVRVRVMGGGGWRDLTGWPPDSAVRRWYLQPGAALGLAAPAASAPDRYTYDPASPTPAVGGSSSLHGGPRDNRALERRPDVLTYTSDPLERPLVVIGNVTARLHVSSSRSHTDFFARLCDVSPDGKSVNVSDGILRLDSATPEPREITVVLWPTAHQFRAGHRIRLQVSSGAHPRFARNTGGAEPLATATMLHAARQAVYHDPDRPSALLLPVISGT